MRPGPLFLFWLIRSTHKKKYTTKKAQCLRVRGGEPSNKHAEAVLHGPPLAENCRAGNLQARAGALDKVVVWGSAVERPYTVFPQVLHNRTRFSLNFALPLAFQYNDDVS